jgi:hypothetical protein
MEPKDRSEEERDGHWRDALSSWTAPEARPSLEHRLRREFRHRRSVGTWTAWASRAAVLALGLSAALAVRWGGAPSTAQWRDVQNVSFVITADAVRTELDLTGFEPVRRPRVTRPTEAITEIGLDGFEPVRTMKATHLNERE